MTPSEYLKAKHHQFLMTKAQAETIKAQIVAVVESQGWTPEQANAEMEVEWFKIEAGAGNDRKE